MTSSSSTSAAATPIEIDGFKPDAKERWAIHSALLAQVDDMHAGGVFSWSEDDIQAARRVIAELSGTPLGEDPEGYGQSISSKVIISSLLVPVYDLDHPDLDDAEWAAAEQLIAAMTAEFGR